MHEQDGANSCLDPETDSDFLSQQPTQPTSETGENQMPHETDTGTGEASSTGELLQPDSCTAMEEQDSPAQQQPSAQPTVITAKEYRLWTAGLHI
eukprot:3555493-Rhodomonas_salina.1